MDARRLDLLKLCRRNLVDVLVRPTLVVEGITELVPLLGGFLFFWSADDGSGGLRLSGGGGLTLVRGRLVGALAKPNTHRAACNTTNDTFERATGDDVLERVASDTLVLDGDVRGVLLLATLQGFERGLPSKAADGPATKALPSIRSSLCPTKDPVHACHGVR